MRMRIRQLDLIVIAAGISLLSGCGADRERLGPAGGPSASWELGNPTSYDVPATPNATVEDTTTHGTFRFAQGGGRLTVTPVLSGPDAEAADGAFQVEYSGTSAVEYLMDHTPDTFEFLLGFENFENMMLQGDEPQTAGWLPLVDGSADTSRLVFQLPLGGAGKPGAADAGGTGALVAPGLGRPGAGARAAGRPLWSGVAAFKPLKVAKGSTHGMLMKDYEANVRSAAASLINAIPPAHRARVMHDMNGPLSPKLYVDMNAGAIWKTSPKYVPFWDWHGLTNRCALILTDDAPESIAHEFGHYLHHVLVGSSVYVNFSQHPRPAGHGVGTTGAGSNLIEEAAYLAEYYLKGRVYGRNPEGGNFAANGPGVTHTPDAVDFPDLEGFTVAMFAGIIREDSTMLNYESRRVPAPVVTGVRDSLFHACYQILAEGTNNSRTVRDKIETYLAPRGQADKLPAIIQPLGWTYAASCRFVDYQGNPVTGVASRPVSIAGGVEYRLPAAAGSDAQGRVHFDVFYPGSSTLRVYINNDSTDITSGINIPWSTLTTQVVDLGDIVVTPDNLLGALHGKTHASVWISGRMTFDDGREAHVVDETLGGSNVGTASPITWSGSSFSYSAEGSWEDLCEGTITWTRTISGTLNESAKTMSAQVVYSASDAQKDYEDTWTLSIVGLPISASSTPPYAGTIRFSKSGSAASGYLGGLTARIWHFCSGYEPGNYLSTDWGNTEKTAVLGIEFTP